MSEFIYTGNLAEQPLPEILWTIHHYQVPGVLKAKRAGVEKAVFILDGEVTFSTSSAPEDRLGEFLLARGVIDRDQYEESARRLKDGRRRQGQVLVEMGAIRPQDLYRFVREQVREILWSLFEWQEGVVTFRVGQFRTDEIIRLQLDTVAAIVEGTRRRLSPRAALQRLGGRTAVLRPARDALQRLRDFRLKPPEQKLLRYLDGIRTVWDVVLASDLPQAETLRTLFLFHLAGALESRP